MYTDADLGRYCIATTHFLPSAEPPSKSVHSTRPATRSRRPPPTRPPAPTAKTDKCTPMLPHATKKKRPASRPGLSQSSTSLSNCFLKSLKAKIIGTKDRSCVWPARENVLKMSHVRSSKILKAMGARRSTSDHKSRTKVFGKIKTFWCENRAVVTLYYRSNSVHAT